MSNGDFRLLQKNLQVLLLERDQWFTHDPNPIVVAESESLASGGAKLKTQIRNKFKRDKIQKRNRISNLQLLDLGFVSNFFHFEFPLSPASSNWAPMTSE